MTIEPLVKELREFCMCIAWMTDVARATKWHMDGVDMTKKMPGYGDSLSQAADALTRLAAELAEAEMTRDRYSAGLEVCAAQKQGLLNRATRAEAALATARKDALMEAAKVIEPTQEPACDCVEEVNGVWVYNCYCQNSGDLAAVQSWCDGMNSAALIRALVKEGENG